MSYLTPAEAQTYFDSYRLFHDAWDCATESQRQVALNQATEIIDSLPLSGYRTTTVQTNQFPRNDETTVPTEITKACAEIAYSLLDGVDPEDEFRLLEVDSTRYASVSTTYSKTRLLMKAYGIPSFVAWKYLARWIDQQESIQLRKA
jgi:hypothetical protein